MHTPPSLSDTCHPRAGLSLLEVLVACGILAIGLASVAALLPAASSRFGQATQADRAGVLAANARAELMNRGLVAADVFLSATQACAFGRVATALTTVSSTVSGTAGRTWPAFAGTASPVLSQRIDTLGIERGFLLEDDLAYRPPSASPTPGNSFMISGTGGPRSFNQALCWGATLVPRSGTAAQGMPATLGVAVFRKAGEAREIVLSGSATPGVPATLRCMGVLSTGSVQTNALAIDAGRRLVLPACGFVLALKNPPEWVRVTSSWTIPGFVVTGGTIVSGTENPDLRRSFVVLDPNPMPSGSSTIRVVGFEGLLRLDQYPVTLE
jgi:hypothetical protein